MRKDLYEVGLKKQSLIKNGFIELDQSELHSDTLSLARSIGCVLNVPNMPLVQTLTPKSIQSTTKNTYSGNYGLDEFPLHTDLAHWYLPPRFFILRCIKPDPKVFTVFLSKDKVLKGLSSSILKRAIFKPRRKLKDKQILLRILQNNIFRWDEKFITPQNDEAHKVVSHINKLRRSKDIFQFCFNVSGQALLIDNWKILHGRSKVDEVCSKREIERVYLTEIIS